MNIKKFLRRKTNSSKSKGDSSHKSEFKSNSNMRYLDAPCKLSKSCPVCMHYYCTQEQKEYIILTPSTQDTNKCYKYDILQNKWIHFTTYPRRVVAECHSACIDQEKDLLYISHGYGSIFAIFDLKNNFWTVHSLSKHNKMRGVVANAPCLSLPNSECHVLGLPAKSNIHLRYDKLEKQFVRASINGISNNCYLETGTLIFLKLNKAWNMLMVLGGYLNNAVTDKIWHAKYTEGDQKDFVWEEFAIDLPFASAPQCCVAFGAVIIIWYVIDDNSAACARMAILDCGVKAGEYEWIEPILEEKCIPNDVTSMVATRSNYVHFVNVYKEMHCKIHLEHLIPPHLYAKYAQDNSDNDVKCEKCDDLQTLVEELVAENSKLKEELVGVKRELNKLKRLNRNIDASNYLNWTGDEIVDWILSLDEGQYEEYEDKLRVKFMEESVDGNAILYINASELKGWGVLHFMDRINLCRHFQQLTKQNNHNEGNKDNIAADTAYVCR